MHNAQDAVKKAHHVSELTSQVSQKESEIRDLKAEIAKKSLNDSKDINGRKVSYIEHIYEIYLVIHIKLLLIIIRRTFLASDSIMFTMFLCLHSKLR